ncbi:uncharacterized protein LOC125371219 [Ricinus communis]|uniref:uncharacterized protein LOC125371219 n=1 Tax=Ricinus communis TaxID=3988 RepID=UPI00201AA8FA|nr:uncharacterized protein LOC125371219 [Ricinus communis]
MISTQFSAKVKIFRTDNGTEYMEKTFYSYLDTHEIIHQTSCVNTAAQNGVSERKNRHLLEVARALMFTMHVPKAYWGDAILTAAYLINRMPLRTLNFRCPIELFQGNNSHIISPKESEAFYPPSPLQGENDHIEDVISLGQPILELPMYNGQGEHKSDDNTYNGDHVQTDAEKILKQARKRLDKLDLLRYSRKKKEDTTLHSQSPNPGSTPVDSGNLSPPSNLSNELPSLNSCDNELDLPIAVKKGEEAVNDPKWKDAMVEEMKALVKNGTWEVVDMPFRKKPVGCKWVFTVKHRVDGSIERLKARLVAKVIIAFGYKQSHADHTMFIKYLQGRITILIVYVDDIVITGDNQVARSEKGIFISQRKYVLDLLKKTGMLGCKPVDTPIEANHRLKENVGELVDIDRYQRLVGRLIYLSHTRPDIAYAVSIVSQFMYSPRTIHLDVVFRILRYLKSSPAYSYADWAGSPNDRRSTSGYCAFMGGNLVTWRSKK